MIAREWSRVAGLAMDLGEFSRRPLTGPTTGGLYAGLAPGDPGPASAPFSLGGEAVKSLGVGLGRNLFIDLFGLPGDAADAAGRALGRDPLPIPTSADLQRKVEGYTGKFYEPQVFSQAALRTIAPELARGAHAILSETLKRYGGR